MPLEQRQRLRAVRRLLHDQAEVLEDGRRLFPHLVLVVDR
jgi:hypothetical protein